VWGRGSFGSVYRVREEKSLVLRIKEFKSELKKMSKPACLRLSGIEKERGEVQKQREESILRKRVSAVVSNSAMNA
jgi:hypothetical protein